MKGTIEKVVHLTGLFGQPINSLTERQILLTQSLISLVPQIGNSLKVQGWRPILELISKLDEIRNSKINSDTTINQIENILSIDYELMERVFIKTKLLDNEAILDFTEALCIVSKAELQAMRTFSLQKLVEVTDFNIDRIKVVWGKMWNIVREHFTEVCTRGSR